MSKIDMIDKKAIDLINGVDCAGGTISAADIADAIRDFVRNERDACAALAHKIAADADPSIIGTASQVWRAAGNAIGIEISRRNGRQ